MCHGFVHLEGARRTTKAHVVDFRYESLWLLGCKPYGRYSQSFRTNFNYTYSLLDYWHLVQGCLGTIMPLSLRCGTIFICDHVLIYIRHCCLNCHSISTLLGRCYNGSHSVYPAADPVDTGSGWHPQMGILYHSFILCLTWHRLLIKWKNSRW